MVVDALASIFAPVLDPILGPLLNLPPIWAILIISLFLSLISLLLTKYLTNQKMMKEHRIEMKVLQKEMKEFTKGGEQKKAMALQKDMMEKNMLIMKESFKPMFITIIPFLLIFGWLYANFSYLPLEANEPFDIDVILAEPGFNVTLIALPELNISGPVVDEKTSTFSASGPEGEYTLQFTANKITVEQDLLIGEKYAKPDAVYSTKPFKKSLIGNEQLHVNILGFDLSWFWAYFLFSMIFSLSLRKVLKVA
jgi:uncharacterized membrane protein (DUF106 family)